jgi:hypothetical protein
MAKPNWKKIAHEYITTDIAMRPLADKYKVSLRTMATRAKQELWTQQRNEYRIKTGVKAVAKNASKVATEPATRDVDEASLLLEGASLAINWIIRRLESDEVSDWREVEGLIRAMNGAKALTKIKMALEEQEQRARIANLEKQTEIADREPVQIDYSRISEEDMT